MKKVVSAFAAMVVVVLSAHAQSAGGGLSVFVPESLYRHAKGTVAFEQGFSTSIGLGPFISIPVGFAYHSTDGYLFEHEGLVEADGPSFYGDSFIPYAGLKAHIPLGPSFYLDAFGGGALNWAFSLQPNAIGLAQNLADGSNQKIAFDEIEVERSIGYGWMVGGAFGIKIDRISIDLGATYRLLMVPVVVTADLRRVDGASATEDRVRYADGFAVLRGVSIRLGGSYALK